MAQESFSTSAPGSLMLMGEHAVLHGSRALACAIDTRMHVRLTPRTDDRVLIKSALGTYEESLHELPDQQELRFVIASIRRFQNQLPGGVRLDITAEFSHQVGFGSSAAVTVAACAGLARRAGVELDRRGLFKTCRDVIISVQGRGSGTDVAASVYGGVISYRVDPLELDPLPCAHPISVVYSGSKKPTVDVIEIVNRARKKDPDLFADLFRRIDQDVGGAIQALKDGNHQAFGSLLDQNQAYMEKMGLSNAPIDAIVSALRTQPGIFGAKISGSGLGDCVVGWGQSDPGTLPGEPQTVTMSKEGLRVD